MRLINNKDHEINFSDLEEAKAYYDWDYLSKEDYEEYEYHGDDWSGYVDGWNERTKMIKEAETLEELANALNWATDIYDDGSSWSVVD